MDISHIYDQKLNTINQYHKFLTDIINKGYNNDLEILFLVDKHIQNFLIEGLDKSKKQQKINLLKSEENMDMLDETEDSSDEESYTSKSTTENKINEQIKEFVNKYNDISKYYIYKNDKKYISDMNDFIKNSLTF